MRNRGIIEGTHRLDDSLLAETFRGEDLMAWRGHGELSRCVSRVLEQEGVEELTGSGGIFQPDMEAPTGPPALAKRPPMEGACGGN